MQSTLSRPYVVTIVPETPPETAQTTVADVLMGSIATAGAMIAVALILGLVFGGIRLAFRKYFPPRADHMPPISPFEPEHIPPSSSPPR